MLTHWPTAHYALSGLLATVNTAEKQKTQRMSPQNEQLTVHLDRLLNIVRISLSKAVRTW